MTEDQLKLAAKTIVAKMNLVEKQARYLELARKVAAMKILTSSEFTEIKILSENLRRDAVK